MSYWCYLHSSFSHVLLGYKLSRWSNDWLWNSQYYSKCDFCTWCILKYKWRFGLPGNLHVSGYFVTWTVLALGVDFLLLNLVYIVEIRIHSRCNLHRYDQNQKIIWIVFWISMTMKAMVKAHTCTEEKKLKVRGPFVEMFYIEKDSYIDAI